MRLVIPALLVLTACVQHHESIDPLAAVCAHGENNAIDIDLQIQCVSGSQFDSDESEITVAVCGRSPSCPGAATVRMTSGADPLSRIARAHVTLRRSTLRNPQGVD